MYQLIKNGQVINESAKPAGSFRLDDGTAYSNIEVLSDEELASIGWIKVSDVVATPTDEEKKLIKENNARLILDSAKHYEYDRISNSGIGLLTMGVLQQKPKCLAVMAWLKDLWSDSFARQASVVYNETPNTDFSNHGEMPYTVLELMEELGV